MLNLLKSISIDEKQILDVIEVEDYRFELSRYEGRITKKEFIDYIKNIRNIKEDDITNMDLKVHHKYYKDLLENFAFYEIKLEEFKRLLKEDIFEEQIKLAMNGLPKEFKLPNIKVMFTIGIGQSFGYAHNNSIHFDFLKLVKENNLRKFISIIGHEIHHVALNILEESIDIDKLTVEEFFYLCFTGEGLAVKYCNNAEGVISRAIYEGEKNIGLDKYTWDYLNSDFENTFEMFKKTKKDIRQGLYKNKDELLKHIEEYWMNPHTEEQSKVEIPKLQHFRLYSFGNDVWGVIHDVFGKDVVFDTFMNPNKFVEVYNRAVELINRQDLVI